MRLPICTVSDITMPVLTYSPHNYAPVPVGPPMPAAPMLPVPASAIDLPTTMLHIPGNMTGKNKYAFTVMHRVRGVIQANHDLGMMLMHIQVVPAPNNYFTPIHTLFSSRKVMFSTSTVKVDKIFVGLAGLIGLPPTPMLVCGEPLGYPLGEVPTRWFSNTVFVGLMPMDLGLGALGIGASLLIDKIFAPKTKAEAIAKLEKAVAAGLKSEIAKKLWPPDKKEWIKTLSKQASGFAQGVISLVARDKDGEAGMTLGSDYANVSVKFKNDDKGNASVAIKGTIPGLGVSVGGEENKGPLFKHEENWGFGGESTEYSPKGKKEISHNVLDGTASTKVTP